MLHIKLQWLNQGSESHMGRQEMVGIGGARDSAVLKPRGLLSSLPGGTCKAISVPAQAIRARNERCCGQLASVTQQCLAAAGWRAWSGMRETAPGAAPRWSRSSPGSRARSSCSGAHSAPTPSRKSHPSKHFF